LKFTSTGRIDFVVLCALMKKSYVILIHAGFWTIVFTLYYSFLIFGRQSVSIEYYINFTVKTLLECCDFYVLYLLIIPTFFKKGKFPVFFLVLIFYLLIYIPLYAVVSTYTNILLGLVENWDGYNFQLVVATYYVVLFAFLGGLFRLTLDGFEIKQQKILLEQQNIKNELAMLRAQVNPHFLFNTLNTIHSYILNNNPNSADAVIKLADIMRYMLHDASRELITLRKEIAYLKSYIELQKFRLERNDLIVFNIMGDSGGILIPPMLLTPFVENAFKHSRKGNSADRIIVDLSIITTQLEFTVSNGFDSTVKQQINKPEGVGLKNVKRRLELLYPQKHMLEINEQDQKFIVKLIIEIA